MAYLLFLFLVAACSNQTTPPPRGPSPIRTPAPKIGEKYVAPKTPLASVGLPLVGDESHTRPFVYWDIKPDSTGPTAGAKIALEEFLADAALHAKKPVLDAKIKLAKDI